MASSNLPHSDFAAQNDEELDTKELLKLRQKCGRFRILVIGRANAGKTTLCQRMCNTEDPPIVHDKNGNVVNILPGQERGIHDINNEITYEANPGFVFHDSGGFESGSSEELEIVRAFIKARAEGTDLRKQLHAIWICLPVDDDRPLLPTEMEFFKEESNSVPVIAVFTKCDARNIKAKRELRNEGIVNYKDLGKLIPLRVHTYLEGLVDYIKQEVVYKPKEFVFLKDMHKGFSATQEQCAELVEKTSQSIDRKALRLLLVSVQQVNMKICIEYAINNFLKYVKKYRLMDKIKEWFPGGASIKDDIIDRVADIMIWFPHFYFNEPYDYRDGFDGLDLNGLDDDGNFRFFRFDDLKRNWAKSMITLLETQLAVSASQQSLFFHVAGCIIIIEASFWHLDKSKDISAHLMGCTSSYLGSQKRISVTNEIKAAHISTMNNAALGSWLKSLVLENLLEKPKNA